VFSSSFDPAGSDDLLAGEELDELLRAVALVVTLTPSPFGGRPAKSSTWLVALARPTVDGSTPRSASDLVSTGFFLAAMIPLKEG
jgi:hypothetical protein